MKKIFEYLYTFFNNMLQSFLGQVLTGAGLGIATIEGIDGFATYYKNHAIAQFGQLGAVSGLLGLSGVDRAISILIGAYLASVYINTFASSVRVMQTKKKS